MDEAKSRAISLGEDAGEAYAQKRFDAGGMSAMSSMLSEDLDQTALDALFKEEDDVHGEHVLTGRVHPYHIRAFCQVFARGAARFRDIVLRGYEHEAIPYPTAADLVLGTRDLAVKRADVFSAVDSRVRAETPDASTDDVLHAFITHFDERSLGDRPALIDGYRAGGAAYRAEHGGTV